LVTAKLVPAALHLRQAAELGGWQCWGRTHITEWRWTFQKAVRIIHL